MGQLTTRSNAGGAVWPVPGADCGDSHRFLHKSLKITSLRHFGRREKEREPSASVRGEFTMFFSEVIFAGDSPLLCPDLQKPLLPRAHKHTAQSSPSKKNKQKFNKDNLK